MHMASSSLVTGLGTEVYIYTALHTCVVVLERVELDEVTNWGLEGEPGKGRNVSKSTRDRNMKESIIVYGDLV